MPTLACVVFLPFACAYLLSFLLRNVNSVVFPELVQEFALGPGALGFLTSAYFLAFASFQIPLGLLLDRYGPRRVNAALLVVAAAGTLVFATAASFSTLVVGRALMGLGFAGCLMSSMTAFILWFPRSRMASLSGIMVAVGSCGALAATKPVEIALRSMSWRTLFVALAVGVIVSAALIVASVPEKRRAANAGGLAEQLRGMRRIYADREFWRVGLPAACVQASGLAFLGLWAGPWLRDVGGLDRPDIAQALLYAAAAFGLGALAFGMLSDRLARRGVAPRTTFAAACILAGLALLGLILAGPRGAVHALPLFVGCAASGTLGFALVTARYPPEMAGRALTALNVLTMGTAFLYQAGMGAVLGFWPAADGHYAPAGHRAALGMLLAFLAVTVAFMLHRRKSD